MAAKTIVPMMPMMPATMNGVCAASIQSKPPRLAAGALQISGLYYLVRSLTITPAASLGGLPWMLAAQTPFIVAGIIGIIGTIVFAATVEEQDASCGTT